MHLKHAFLQYLLSKFKYKFVININRSLKCDLGLLTILVVAQRDIAKTYIPCVFNRHLAKKELFPMKKKLRT